MGWKKLLVGSMLRGHVAPEEMEDDLVDDLDTRYPEYRDETHSEPCETIFFERYVGPTLSNNKRTEVEIDGLVISWNLRESNELLTYLEKLPVRISGRTQFVKAIGGIWCLCLYPRHRDVLVAYMRSIKEESYKVAKKEFALLRMAFDPQEPNEGTDSGHLDSFYPNDKKTKVYH
tara:strand:- start:49 stop:573 length:525 start_codon:yes stop_codon:yes gene_type:complete